MTTLYLASGSPRRQELLTQLGLAFERLVPGIEEQQQTLDCLVVTEVTFRRLSEQDIADYVASGEPLDKAGAYGIQGLGGCFVRKINGSYHAVVGLPLVETYELLSNFNSLRKGKG